MFNGYVIWHRSWSLNQTDRQVYWPTDRHYTHSILVSCRCIWLDCTPAPTLPFMFCDRLTWAKQLTDSLAGRCTVLVSLTRVATTPGERNAAAHTAKVCRQLYLYEGGPINFLMYKIWWRQTSHQIFFFLHQYRVQCLHSYDENKKVLFYRPNLF